LQPSAPKRYRPDRLPAPDLNKKLTLFAEAPHRVEMAQVADSGRIIESGKDDSGSDRQ
jgi:hypothetical protein